MPVLLYFVGYWSEKIVYYIIYYFFGVPPPSSEIVYYILFQGNKKGLRPLLYLVEDDAVVAVLGAGGFLRLFDGVILTVEPEALAILVELRNDEGAGDGIGKVVDFGCEHFCLPLFLFCDYIITHWDAVVKRFFQKK